MKVAAKTKSITRNDFRGMDKRFQKGVAVARALDARKHTTLLRSYKQTVFERVERDPQFATALPDEAATLFLSGEPATARVILRNLVNATIGFEQLAQVIAKPSKSLHRMVSPRGNPSMDNLAAIFEAVRHWLQVAFEVHTVEAR